MLRRVLEFFSDYLFPVYCVGCQEEGEWLCKKCKRRNKIRPFIFYPVNNIFSRGVFSFFLYTAEDVWGKLIWLWKYHYVTEIKAVWDNCIRDNNLFLSRYWNYFDRQNIIYLVPVPLHPRRLRERGFNQAQEFAELLLVNLLENGYQAKILNCLKRVRYTAQQAKLSPMDRKKNLVKAFVFENKNIIPEQVILVDDVFTTGFTMQECANVLSFNGVEKIGAIVLAHG